MRLTEADRRRIKRLRYRDGLTSAHVAVLIGCSPAMVRRVAPGRIGKVPNDKLRVAFQRSPVTASEVARGMGWWAGSALDTSRVRRTLGLMPDSNGPGHSSMRSLVDAETVERLAEAIGVAPWEVMPDEAEEAVR